MPIQQMDLYVCRRCTPEYRFRTYENLRAHLRARHRIQQLPRGDIPLYEAFPNSHQQYLDGGAPEAAGAAGGNINPFHPANNEIVGMIDAAIENHFRNNRVVVPNVDLQPILAAINKLRIDLAAQSATNNLGPIENAITELNSSIQNLLPASIPVTLGNELEAVRNDLRKLPPFQPLAVELNLEPVVEHIKQMQAEFVGQIASSVQEGIKSALTMLTEQIDAKNTHQTVSDEELMNIPLPVCVP